MSDYGEMKGAMLLTIGLAAAACAGSALAANPRSATEAEISYVKKAMAEKLKDPESARYSDMQVLRSEDGVLTVCGNVNSKNSYGGYVGASRFMGLLLPEKKDAFIIQIDTADKRFAVTLCSQKGM